MQRITAITPRIIRDSRGAETVSVTAYAGDISETFSVPSGASTGAHEACELRDQTSGSVRPAITAIEEILAPLVVGHNVFDQKGIDRMLVHAAGDQKKRVGANSTLAISGAVARLGAKLQQVQLYQYLRAVYSEVSFGTRQYPLCYFNLINGGKHAHTGLAFQEYHVVPDCGNVADNITCARQVYGALKNIVAAEYPGTVLGDEGGFALSTDDLMLPLDLLERAVQAAGYHKSQVGYALDVAASSFFENGQYRYEGGLHSAAALTQLYEAMIQKAHMVSIEDPFDEESFEDFATFAGTHEKTIVIGDDLTVTNVERLAHAERLHAIGGLIIKPNQIGTISETVAAIAFAHQKGFHTIISHRSGETLDTTIADIAWAFHSFGLKAGAPGPQERVVKYERLQEITKHLI